MLVMWVVDGDIIALSWNAYSCIFYSDLQYLDISVYLLDGIFSLLDCISAY